MRFAHDLYADYARQRYMLSLLFSQRLEELKVRQTNPLWHRALRLVGLHLLEYQDAEHPPDVTSWRKLKAVFEQGKSEGATDEESNNDRRTGVGLDLLLECIAFAAQPRTILDRIREYLFANNAALLKSFLFRLRQAAIQEVPLRKLVRDPDPAKMTPDLKKLLDQPLALPDFSSWFPVIEWMARNEDAVIVAAPSEFLDAAEFWFDSLSLILKETLFELPHTRYLASMLVGLAERAAQVDREYSNHRRIAVNRERLYRLMLLCGRHERKRVRPLVRTLAGLDDPAFRQRPTRAAAEVHDNSERIQPRREISQRSRSGAIPPEDFERIQVPPFWPLGPRSEPNQAFRAVALSKPGAERLLAIDSTFAKEVFLSLIIERPDRYRGHRGVLDDSTYGYDWDAATRSARPPFWNFAPSHLLLKIDPHIGIEFIIELVDFATDRWAERWPDVPRAGSMFSADPDTLPQIVLTIGGVPREYVGDARVLEWHQGGLQGPNVAAAALMSLEKWLYEQNDLEKLDDETVTFILTKTHSVAVVGVLFDLALKNPFFLTTSLEPLVQCPELHHWGRMRRVDPKTAMIAWNGKLRNEVKEGFDWHSLPHRDFDFIEVVRFIFVRRNFEWPAITEARERWIDQSHEEPNERLQDWIQDIMLCYFDKNNYRSVSMADGQLAWEYVHPQAIQERQVAERQEIERGMLRRHFPLRCRRILEGKDVIDEQALVPLLEFAAAPTDQWSKDDIILAGGPWGHKCAAAAIAIVKFDSWLRENPIWMSRCREWLTQAVLTSGIVLEPGSSMDDLSWNSFCAEALPLLWLREPIDVSLRKCVARLVGASSEQARQRLFVVLHRERAAHSADFRRLLHLAVWTARLMVLNDFRRYLPTRKRSGNTDAEKVFLRMAEDFVKGRLEVLPENWPDIADAWPKGIKPRKNGGVRAERNGFRDSTLVAVFAWLGTVAPSYGQEHDRDFLRALVVGLSHVVCRRVSTYDDAVVDFADMVGESFAPASLVTPVNLDEPPQPPEISPSTPSPRSFLSMIQEATKWGVASIRTLWKGTRAREAPRLRAAAVSKRRQSIGRPYQTDDAIAERCAQFVVRESNAGARRQIWEPWFQLGNAGNYWVDLLLEEIYRAAMTVEEGDSIFTELLRDLFDTAFADGAWLDHRSRRDNWRDDVACAFIGFGNLAQGKFWSANHAHVAIALREYWPRWVDATMLRYGCAKAFIRFLSTPAANPLRPASLQWLVQAKPDQWLKDDAHDALIRLLELVWQEHLDGAVLTGEPRVVFEQLLHELAARHVPDAVRISKLVTRGG